MIVPDITQHARKIRNVVVRAFRECNPASVIDIMFLPFLARIIWHLEQGDHKVLTVSVNRLMQLKPQGLGAFYYAHSQLLTGHYEECRKTVITFLMTNPYHADACYLLASASAMEGHSDRMQKETAWLALEKLAQKSRRLKTWLVMANLVENLEDFRRLVFAWEKACDSGHAPVFHVDVSHYLSIGALRAGEFEAARNIWRQALEKFFAQKTNVAKSIGKPMFSPHQAAIALHDVTNMLGKYNIPSFLISGTLLGCIREGGILNHDKDVDIGIWEDVPRQLLLDIVGGCGLFYIQPQRARETIRLKHVNGTAIDIFYHIREPGDYWHAGIKARWHNSPFTLTKKKFLGDEYLIPEDYDTYLQENYGDWRTPKTPFDSVYDTPNAEIVNEDEMAVHDYRMLMHGLIHTNKATIKRYAEKLRERGEIEFLPSKIITILSEFT